MSILKKSTKEKDTVVDDKNTTSKRIVVSSISEYAERLYKEGKISFKDALLVSSLEKQKEEMNKEARNQKISIKLDVFDILFSIAYFGVICFSIGVKAAKKH